MIIKGEEMRYISIILLYCMFWTTQVAADETPELSAEEQAYIEQAKNILESLNPQHGEIKLSQGDATLNVPETFYYLNPQDSEKVLVNLWGNLPGQPTLGMLFPADMSPLDDNVWAVTIEYEEEGYVSDEDADDIDYNDLLKQMKEEIQAQSEYRMQQGYESIALVGWAAKPFYDRTSHKLHWAKELRFGEQELNTLNYNIRILGRKGVLVLNFIAGIDQLEMIDSQIDTVLNIAEFDNGARYADFNPDIDKVAAYGLGALIAGKVAAKTGLLATLLVLFKKVWIFLILGIGVFFKKLFGRKETSNSEQEENK